MSSFVPLDPIPSLPVDENWSRGRSEPVVDEKGHHPPAVRAPLPLGRPQWARWVGVRHRKMAVIGEPAINGVEQQSIIAK